MYRRTLAIFIGVLAAAAFAAGCGGDDGDSLTKAEFAKKGSAMCERVSGEGEAKLLAYVKEKEKEGGPQSLSRAKEAELIQEIVAPSLKEQAEEFEELGAPEGEEEKLDELIAELNRMTETAENDPEAFATEPAPYAKSEKIAKELGLTECGHQ